MSNPRQAMRPKEMIQSLLMIGWTEIGIAQFCGVSQATVNRNRHALYGNPRFNLVSGLQELMESPTPINRTKAAEPMPQTTHWEGCEAVHPECKAKPITAAEMSAWVKDTWEKCQAEAWQEPVAWLYRDSWGTMKLSQIMPPPVGAFPVYTAPTPRKPLTDEEIEVTEQRVWSQTVDKGKTQGEYAMKFARAIERAHGIGEQHGS